MSCTQPIRNENDLNKFRNYYRTTEDKPRNYVLIEFGLNSALRISDILALHWNDVYLTSTDNNILFFLTLFSKCCMIVSTKKIVFLYVLKNCVHLYLISLNYFDFDLI